ncbi:uncharacterized protein [Aristolochia californica]|uniref:uncharacterized protein n=1 Tax=Aristolochia californica TaxID=171875 RepID=UPI0035D80F35
MMAIKKNFPLISYSAELIEGQAVYVSSNCLPVKAQNFEPAGQSFHNAILKLCGFSEEETEEDTEGDDHSVSDGKGQAYSTSSDSYSTKGKKKSTSGGTQQDHYALLGLGHLRFLATEEQIKKSYRETALRHHPDKQAALLLTVETEETKQEKRDEIENHFKAIQEAYEVLIDPVKRRIYDSTDEFDDEIPTDCAPQDFFKVFGPAFMRNGRWSVKQPVPSLGEDNTPVEEVDSFYNFWYNFKSWREFPHADEFDVEQAESRDHKRWMERQNAKLREKARKEEYVRVRTLVDNAYKRDPRILKRKEEEKAEKQRKKEAKYLAKKLQEDEAARAAEEEKRRKEEEERLAAEAALNQKRQKEKEKKLVRKERTRLRNLSGPITSKNLLDLSDSDVESLCMKLELVQLKTLCDKMESKDGNDRAQLLKEAVREGKPDDTSEEKELHHNGSLDSKLGNGVASEIKPSNVLGSYEKKEKLWNQEEIELLRKGMQKYPKGTSRRWEVISEYIGTGRSVEEILKATKTVLLQKPDSAKAFDSFLEKRKPAHSIASPLTTREELEGSPAPVGATGATGESPRQGGTQCSGRQQDSTAHPILNGVSSSGDQDVWSATQEKALIQALKAFPKETNQRWERVAAAVPGKTVNQCKKKFAALKENFRSKKTASN